MNQSLRAVVAVAVSATVATGAGLAIAQTGGGPYTHGDSSVAASAGPPSELTPLTPIGPDSVLPDDDTTTTVTAPQPGASKRPAQRSTGSARTASPSASPRAPAAGPPPIAFMRNSAEAVDVWMMAPDGSGEHRIDSYPLPAQYPGYGQSYELGDWSPDGQRFFVLRHVGFQTGVHSTSLQMYDRSGARLAKFDVSDIFGAAWSPDGTQIAASWMNDPQTQNLDPDIVIYDATSGNRVRAIPGMHSNDVAWAPSSRLATFGTRGSLDGLFTLAPDGSDVRHPAESAQNGTPVWSGDGRVLYARDGSAGRPTASYVVTDATGALPRQVCEFGGPQAWSPDASIVAVTAYEGQADHFHLTLCRSDSGTAVATIPDGRDPAFDSSGHVLFAKNHEVWTMNADGTGQHRLTAGNAPKPAPR